MSAHPSITIAYDLTQSLNTATEKIRECEQLLCLIDIATYHRKELAIGIDVIATPLSIAHGMLDEATQLLESVNEPINKIRADVHEQNIADKREGRNVNA